MNETVTWADTISLIRADIGRRLYLEGRRATVASALWIVLKPGAFCIVVYRVNNWLHHRGFGVIVRVLHDLQHLYTGIELHAGSVIGPGLVLSDLGGIGIPKFAVIGENCTIVGTATITIGGLENIDLSVDRIVVGRNCIIGGGARLLGAIELADGTQVKPNSVVLQSSTVPGTILSGVPARRKEIIPIDLLERWNPLMPSPITSLDATSTEHAPAPTAPSAVRLVKAPSILTSFRRLRRLLRSDIAFRCAYEKKPFKRMTALRMLLHPGASSAARYRLQCFFFEIGMGFVGQIFKALNLVLYGIEIDENAEIAGGLYIAHAVSIIISRDVTIGERCVLFHQNTIGVSPFCEPGKLPGPLVIGNDVTFGGGSCAYGNIVIGDGCKIGANSVVDRSIPSGSVVFGVPARMIAKSKESAKEAV